jgi:hypothetical protein
MAKKAKIIVKPEDFDRVKLARLQKLVDQKRSDLDWHHAVGRLVGELLPDRGYRKGEMEGLVDLLKRNGAKVSRVPLSNARDFARKYSERDLPTLQGLTFNHLCRLFVVQDHNRRDWYRDQCQKNNWSSRQLSEKIYEEFGRRSKGGHRLKKLPPGKLKKVGPKAALHRMIWLRDVALNRCVPMLEQHRARLAKRMSRQTDDELVALVDEACSALDELHKAVTEARTKLRQVKSAAKARSG